MGNKRGACYSEMKKIGLEQEFFLLEVNQDGSYNLVDVPLLGLPFDECGYLVEARGEPNISAINSAYSLLGAVHKLGDRVEAVCKREERTLYLLPESYRKVSPRVRNYFLRKYGKNASRTKNLYGKAPSNNSFLKAGLHVHFSDFHIEKGKDDVEIQVHNILDIPTIVRKLDEHFRDEIRSSKRTIGNYEIKSHGFEYRSLPTSIDTIEVAEIAMEIFSTT